LKGSVSLPSDENGFAKFDNLQIVGSTFSFSYIHLICDGTIRSLWIQEKSAFFKDFAAPNFM